MSVKSLYKSSQPRRIHVFGSTEAVAASAVIVLAVVAATAEAAANVTDTVRCGHKPQHLTSHREAIIGLLLY